jgi:hypothetical protein
MKKSVLLIFGLIASIGLTTGLTAEASQRTQASFAHTFAFPMSKLEQVEQAIHTAAARTGKAMEDEVDYQIDSDFTVRCVENSPIDFEGTLYGCGLMATIDVNGSQITLRHMLYMTQTTQEMKDILANTDPNKTDTVAFKTIFDGGRGSRYYCNAEGAAGARQWACYLYFID